MTKYRVVKDTAKAAREDDTDDTDAPNSGHVHQRLYGRRNVRLPAPVTTKSTPPGGKTLLSILQLFVLVCVLSLLLTLALLHIVSRRADTTSATTTSSREDKPPLPVEGKTSEEKRSLPGHEHPGKSAQESIMLSKMLQERQQVHDTPSHRRRKSREDNDEDDKDDKDDEDGKDDKDDELKEAIMRELAPREHAVKEAPKRPVQTPAPVHEKTARLTPAPAAGRGQGRTDAPSLGDPDTRKPAPERPQEDTQAPAARHTPAPTKRQQPHEVAAPSADAPARARARKEPPGLPVVRHVSREPEVPTWQEKATLQEIENFIFRTTPFVNFSIDITEGEIENFEVILPQTIPNYRAPCWLEDVPIGNTYEHSIFRCHVTFRRIIKGFDFMESVLLHRQLQGRRWRIRCLPAFYLIGVLKSGTTDMYECLSKHPNILQPEIKEPEYWSRQRFQISSWLFRKDCLGSRTAVTFGEYLDVYDKPSEAIRLSMNKRLDGSLFTDVIFGDYSTHTFVELVGWDKTLDAPRYVSAHHIHQIAPQSKFILMLRDPVERAYSRYKMRYAKQKNVQGTAAEFHLRMLQEVKDTVECLKSNSRRYCVYKENFGREGYHTMLVHGMYVVYLNDWLSIIPRDQLYVVRFEDYVENRLDFADDIAYFLGVGPFPENVRKEIQTMPPPNPSANIGDMMEETRASLREFYRKYNHELADVLHDKRYKWGY